jgi:hypothetical protein
MFIFRSAFWLIAAFILVQPSSANLPIMDMQSSVRQLTNDSIEVGRNAARDGLDLVNCASLECTGVKFLAEAALQDSFPAAGAAKTKGPYPRPYLAR